MTTYDRKVRQPAAQPGQSAQTPEALRKPKVPAGGPLTRLVREAQRPSRAGQPTGQDGETNWTEVAQAVTTRYHELEGKVSAVDLLGAIRELPEGGVQDLVISGVGGAHAEQLKLALRSPAPGEKTTTPTPLPRLRAVTPGAAGTAGTSPASPLTATATPAATKVPATGKTAEKGKVASVPASPKAKGKTPAKAPPTNPRARLQLPQRHAGPQGAPAKGVKSATPQAAPAGHAATSTATPGQKGGAGQAGNLIVAHRDEFKGLNVALKPSMERGGKLVFSPAAWRAAEKNVQQELKKRQPLHARNLQGPPQAQQARPQPGPARQVRPQQAPGAKQPLKVPSATIKAAEIKKHEQQNRQKNQAKLKGVVAQANKTRSAIASVQPKATAQITAAQKGAEATITAALQKTLGQIRSAEASARSAVTAKASAATARVTSAHQATVQGIRQDTTQKITTLKQSGQTLKAQLTAEKARMDTGVRGEFNKASATARTIGAGQASSARSTGQSYAARYSNEPLPEQNALQKLANGDDYYAKKREAKVQAALDVSSSYATELTKAGGDQASQIMQSLPDALASNQTILNEYQKQLDTFLQTQVTALQTQQQNAITQANQQRTSLISQINAQRSQALSSIAQAASQGRSQATSQANSKKQAVRAQGQQAVKGVTSSVKQAQAQMQGRIQGFQQAMQGKLTLDAPEFAKAVSGFESYAQKGGTQAQAQVTRSASASAGRLKASAAPAAQALSSLGQGTASSLKAQGTQTGTALTALANSGATGLKQALTSHQQATRAAVTGAQQQFKTFSEGIRKDGEKTVKDVNTQLEKTADPFRDALTGALAKEPGDIEAKASEASNAVQPRWKGILKVVIDVVIVVATIAATIALAAVLGPVGLVLAGMAIGALGAVVGQGLKDAVDGKFSGWEAYGAAALGGAIGGAFGGAGGAVGNILAKGAMKGVTSGLAKGAMRVGVEATVGTGFDLAGQVATGYTNQAVFNQPYKLSDTFNVKNVAMTGVMNTAGTALGSPSVVKFVGGKLSNINIPGKGQLGKFQNTLSNSRPIKAINTLDAKITSSKAFTSTSAALEKVGERLGNGVSRGGTAVKNGTVKAGQFIGDQAITLKNNAQKGYQNARDWTGQKANQIKSTAQDFAAWSKGQLNDAGTYLKGRPDATRDWLRTNGKTNLKAAIKEMALGSLKKPGINQISNYLFDGKFGSITDATKEAVEGGVKGAAKGATKDPKLPDGAPAPTRKQQTWKVTKDTLVGAGSGVVARFINNLTFTGRIGSSAEYLISAIEGGLGGAGGRFADISSTALLKAVMKENTNRYVKVLGKFASDSGLKSVFDFGMKNLANVANGNLFGSAYTWKNLLSGKEIVKVLANSGKFANLGKDLLPLVKTDLKRAGNALSEWKTQQWANLKDHLNTLGTKANGKINDTGSDSQRSVNKTPAIDAKDGSGNTNTKSSPSESSTTSEANAKAVKAAENEERTSVKSIESNSASGDLSDRGYKPRPGERSTTRQEWKAQQRLERIRESRLRVENELNARMQTRIDQIPEGPQKKRMLDLLRQVDELDFSTRPDQASVYSGRVGDVSNRDLALEHMERGGDAIDGTPGGKWLESQDLYTVFKPDYELADLVWMKASMKYATGAQGDIHTFVDGASPERVFHTVEKPLLQSNADVERWVRHRNSGKKEVTPLQGSTSSTSTNQKTTTTPPQTSSDKSAATPDSPINRQNELLNALPENLRSQIPVERDPTLNGNTVRVDYSFSSRGVEGIRIKVGPDATPRDIELHARTVTTLQKYSGLQGRVRSLLERLTTRLGLKHVPPPGSRAWEAKHELEKLSGIIQDRQATLAVTTDSTQRTALETELTSLEAQVQLHENALGNLHDGNGYIAMLSNEDLKLITTRPDEFRASTKDILMKRQPDLHSTRDHLNHDVIGDVSRNHIVAFGHTRLVMLNNLLSRDNSEIFDFMTRLGRNPLSQADKDLTKNVRQLMLDLYNSSNNLYVGPSIQNSAAGNRMKLLMGERLKLTAEPDSSTFRDLTKRYVKEAVDVPPGVSNGSGKDVSDNATRNAETIDRLYTKWDSFEDIRREAFRIRSGEISPDEISIDMLLAQSNLRDLRSHIEQLLPDLHGGSLETNAFLRSKLEKALELEILLTEATNAVNLRGEVIP